MEGIDFLYCNICLSEKGESKKFKQLSRHLKDKHDISTYLYKTLFLHSPTVCIETHSKISENNGMKKPEIVRKRLRKCLFLHKEKYEKKYKGKEIRDYVYCEICRESHNMDRDKFYNIPYYERKFHYVTQHLTKYHYLSDDKIKEYKDKYFSISEDYHNNCSKITEKSFNNSMILQERKVFMENNNPMNNPELVKKVSLSIKEHYKTEEGKRHKEKIRLSNMTNKERAKKISNSKTDWDFYKEYGTFRSKVPYDVAFNKKLKDIIAKRDNYTCQVCKIKFPFSYHTHHTDYNKMNTKPLNLIYLCGSCHSKTNYNREYWKSYFVTYQKERKDTF